MLYPSYVSPDNIPVDPTKPVPISFRFSGTNLITFMVTVYDCDTGDELGKHTVDDVTYWTYWYTILNPDTVYNGDTITAAFDFSSFISSGKDYQYTLKVCQSVHDIVMFSGYTVSTASDTSHVLIAKGTEVRTPKTFGTTEATAHYICIGSESLKIAEIDDSSNEYTKLTVSGNFSSIVASGTRYTVKSNYVTSKPYKFLARTPATVTASAAVSDDGTVSCTASYSQAQNIQIKKFRWQLYKSSNSAWVQVAESDDIYTAKLSYTFSEYIDTSQYKAVCTVTDQYNCEIAGAAEFSYTRTTEEAVDSVNLDYDSEKQCIKLKINAVSGLEWAWYNVYRQEVGSDKIRMIGRCGGGTEVERYITDYLIQSGKTYKYYISPTKSDRTICATYTTEEITVGDFDEWSLTALSYSKTLFDYDTYMTGASLKFSLDAKADSVKVNRQTKVSETISGLPLISKSDEEYVTGNFSALIGNFDMEYENDDIKQIEKIRRFFADSEIVLIKSPKGTLYIASIAGQGFSLDSNVDSLPTMVSFSFTEILKPEKIIINYEY